MRIVTSPDLTIDVLSVGPMDNNVYLLRDPATGRITLVDAANDAADVIDACRTDAGDVPVERIITTHRHGDHIGALADVAAATAAPAYAGTRDAQAIQDATGVPQEPIGEGEEFTVGAVAVRVVELVGHTPGGIALVVEPSDHAPVVVTGDSLFPGGVGKTSSPEDFASLLGDVQKKLFAVLPDDAVVLPGHGAATTLGAERPHLDEWRKRGW